MNQSYSYWEKRTFFEQIDVLVVGSGIVGLFTALEIKSKAPDCKVVVVERGILPNGASTKNAGFCCFGSLSELLDDLQHFSMDESLDLVKMRFEGLKKLRSVLGDEKIGYNPCGGYELFTEKDDLIFEKCYNNIEKYNQLLKEIIGKEVYTSDKKIIAQNEFSNKLKNSIKNNYEGSVDTGLMIKNLIKYAQLKDIIILNNVKLNNYLIIEDNHVSVHTNEINFKTKKIVFTTNGFASEHFPELDISPARAQVLVTSVIDNLKLNGTFHYDRGYNYFRNINGRILLGGGRNLDFEGETTTDLNITDQIQDHLETMLREIIIPGKKFTIDYRWSGVMGVGKIKKPIIEKVDTNTFVAVRMGGMGVAIGSKVGELAAELVVKDL